MTGQEVNSVDNAYNICRRYDSGGSSLITRPEPSELPAGSPEGQPPSGLTDEDLNGDFKDVVRKIFKEEGYIK
jgi:hypothetical protein